MIIPGINRLKFEDIVTDIKNMEGHVRMVQIDFEDNDAVDGLSFLNIEKLNEINTQMRFDLDMMVTDPIPYIQTKIKNADKICFLADTDEHISSFIQQSKTLGYQVGLSLRPNAPFSNIAAYVNKLDYVQLFAIRPGGSGREFQVEVLEKIENIHRAYPNLPLQIDGGMDEDLIPLVKKAGITDIIITSKIFKAENPKVAIDYFVNLEKQY